MSRDAKVGVVIIFAFVFLVGTIVVHRFHWLGGTGNAALTEPVVTESDADAPGSELGTTFPVTDGGVSPVAVDARPADTLLPGSQAGGAQGHESAFPEAQRLSRTPNLTRPPSELPASQANGALISLTESETYQQPAAIVESTASRTKAARRDGSRRAEVPDMRDGNSTHSQPLLEIHNPGTQSDRNDMQTSQLASEDDAAELRDTASRDSAKGQNAEGTELDATTDTNEAKDALATEQPYTTEQHGRPLVSRTARDPFESDDADDVQQTSGRQRPAREPESPPPLPKFGQSHQATIESVPPRDGQPDRHADTSIHSPNARSAPVNRTVPGKTDAVEDSPLAAQRTYVVKEGDSFWSISAKQYGTGKYFRALEEFNGHRLAAYEDGRRILRAGTEILLPDPAVLRSKGAASRQASTSVAPDESDGFKRRQGLDASPERNATDSPPFRANSGDVRTGREASKTYRVQDGDTLSMIAQRELGSSKRWQEIYELNRENLDDRQTLRIGIELKLPSERTPEKLVERPHGGR